MNMKWSVLILVLLIGLGGCASTMRVPVHSYKSIAVVGFEGPADKPEAGRKMENLLGAWFLNTKSYKVMERSQIERILDEQQFLGVRSSDKDSIMSAGKILGVDALVFGSVNAYDVEHMKAEELAKETLKEESTSSKTSESATIHTGEEYERTGRKKPLTLEGLDIDTTVEQAVEKEEGSTTKEVFVTKEIISKKGYVSADVRMVDVRTGEIIQSRSREREKIYIATTTMAMIKIPSDDKILDQLMKLIVRDFTIILSPGGLGKNRTILKGKGGMNKQGFEYARKGLWQEAVAIWEQAGTAVAYNNIGVVMERDGNRGEAIEHYQKAMQMMPGDNSIMYNLRAARKDEEEAAERQ